MTYIWDISNPKTYNNKMGVYKFKVEYKFIQSQLTSNCSILDIGGGSGRIAIPILNLGYSVTVIEKSEEALQILSKRNPKINVILCDFMEYQSKTKYEIILAIEVLQYINDWDLFFTKISNHLIDNGKFIFTTINPNSWR